MHIFYMDSDVDTLNVFHSIIPLLQSETCTFRINVSKKELFDTLLSEKTSIIFLDTRHDDGGFSLAKAIREFSDTCHIVFLSDHVEDMSFCFKNLIRPSGFILKPAGEAEFLEIIRSVLQQNCGTVAARVDKICLSAQNFQRILAVGDILYFSTRGKKLVCRTREGENIEFYGTIKNLSSRYAGNFIRCHSGFLANRDYIRGMHKGMLELKNCTELLPISKRHRAEISAFLRHGA